MDHTMLQLAASNTFRVAGFDIPWGIVGLILVVLVGLFLIRAAVTLVKVLIVVAIGVAIWIGLQYLLAAL